jgi:hypothetical protein
MGGGGIFPPFFTSAHNGDMWLGSRPYRLTLRGRAPDTHSIAGCVFFRVGLGAVE